MTLTPLSIILITFISLILLVQIINQPLIGLIFVAASLPITELLPGIPFISSVLPLLGGLSLLGYLLHSWKSRSRPLRGTRTILLIGLFFITWVFLTHPNQAWFGRDRNWIFTYGQLLILAFLVSELLVTPQQNRIFFWVFAVSAMVSSFVAIQQGYIGNDISTSVRTGGLSEGANSAGRYFVVGMIFLIYLYSVEKKTLLKFLAASGIVLTFIGVFYTVSRTSIILLVSAIGLSILLAPKRRLNIGLIILFFGAIFLLTSLSESVVKLVSTIIPTISTQSDTFGLRIKLWQAAWKMWLDYPLAGVGIGMYRFNLYRYAVAIPSYYLSLVAHSTYFQLLSETGIIGTLLWLTMPVLGISNLWKQSMRGDLEDEQVNRVWLIALFVLLIGAITMTQSAEKLIWLTFGVSQRAALLAHKPHPKLVAEESTLQSRRAPGRVRTGI